MHRLRHEAKSIKVRTSLENFVCKFNADPPLNPHFTYYERIGSNNLEEVDTRPKEEDIDDVLLEDVDDTYIDEPKKAKAENERTLLQIPVELLPCPVDVKSVTDRTYTYPSQNEAKDYRNLIQTSATCSISINISALVFPLLLLLGYE